MQRKMLLRRILKHKLPEMKNGICFMDRESNEKKEEGNCRKAAPFYHGGARKPFRVFGSYKNTDYCDINSQRAERIRLS